MERLKVESGHICGCPLTPPDCGFGFREHFGQALETEQGCLQCVPGPLALTPGAFIKEEEDEHCPIEFGKDAGGRGRGEGSRNGCLSSKTSGGGGGAGAQQGMRQNLRLEPHLLHAVSCDRGALLGISAYSPHP